MTKSKRPEFLAGGLASIRVGLEELDGGRVAVLHPGAVRDSIKQLWEPPEFVAYMRESPRAMGDAGVAYRPADGSDWVLGMTDEFRKGIEIVDRKLQGRVLQAISYIARTPLASRGDTVKALSGELRELWRYRIGDYRLVYRPDEARRQVMLVAFTNRGDAYG